MRNRVFATLSLLFLLLAASAVHAQAENLTIFLDVPGVSDQRSDPISHELQELLVQRVSKLVGEAVVMGQPGSFVILPTTVVASSGDTLTWTSPAPFVVHFNEGTPIRGPKDNVTIQSHEGPNGLHVTDRIPIGNVDPNVYKYSVALCKTENGTEKVYIHVSGEVKKRP
jgi:hypothetical protein